MFVFAARGGLYAGTPRDTQTPYVRDFLSFLGMDDVEFVYAEGLALGDDHQKKALDRAPRGDRSADRAAAAGCLKFQPASGPAPNRARRSIPASKASNCARIALRITGNPISGGIPAIGSMTAEYSIRVWPTPAVRR